MNALSGEGTRKFTSVVRPEGWEDSVPLFVYDPEVNNYIHLEEESSTKVSAATTVGSMSLRCAS